MNIKNMTKKLENPEVRKARLFSAVTTKPSKNKGLSNFETTDARDNGVIGMLSSEPWIGVTDSNALLALLPK
jgi:hypothetical protein